jgi:hypothetical protein
MVTILFASPGGDAPARPLAAFAGLLQKLFIWSVAHVADRGRLSARKSGPGWEDGITTGLTAIAPERVSELTDGPRPRWEHAVTAAPATIGALRELPWFENLRRNLERGADVMRVQPLSRRESAYVRSGQDGPATPGGHPLNAGEPVR